MSVTRSSGFVRVVTLCAWLAAGCDAGESGVVDQPTALTPADRQEPWAEMPLPRAEPHLQSLLSTPRGLIALYREIIGGKAITAIDNYLYGSDDGVTWEPLPLPATEPFFHLRGLGQGGDLHVLAGHGADNEVWTSRDLQTWVRKVIGVSDPENLAGVSFVGGKFFALSTGRSLLGSTDGLSWADVSPPEGLQWRGVAHGNGRFLAVGSGPIAVSENGQTWQASRPPCDLPGACITDPGGGVHSGAFFRALFAEGRFFVDALTSADGSSWTALPQDRRGAEAYREGYVFRHLEAGGLLSWRRDETPVRIETRPHNPQSGATCATHLCIVVGKRVYRTPRAR